MSVTVNSVTAQCLCCQGGHVITDNWTVEHGPHEWEGLDPEFHEWPFDVLPGDVDPEDTGITWTEV